MSEQQTAASGAGAGAATTETQSKTVASLAELSPELQDELNKLLARKEKEWEKRHAPSFDKAKRLDELEKQRQEEADKEKSEIEKLRAKYSDYDTLKEQLNEYSESFKAILEAKLAAVPQENKDLIPDLPDRKLLEWLEKNSTRLYGSAKSPVTFSPTGGKPPTADADPVRQEAIERATRYYPNLKGTKAFEEKVNRIHEQLKNATIITQ